MIPIAVLAAGFAQSSSILLNVDATDAPRGIFHVREVLNANGEMTLTYPKWIPGEHGPDGPISDVVDIHFVQALHELGWRRDPSEPYTFHIAPKEGAVEVDFEYVASPHEIGSRNLARIKWNRLIFLPNGDPQLQVKPTLSVPDGWSVATPLDFNRMGTLETTSIERLIDSPVIIGKYYRSYPVGSPGLPPANLEVFTEKPYELPSKIVEDHARLYREEASIFGNPHFRHYQFLLTLSDLGGFDGLEHNECSEDGTGADDASDPDSLGELDAHEFTHSWNGKYRRPEGLGNPNYSGPMRDSDLWVYEGFTQFWGFTLAARSGFSTREQYLDHLAGDLSFEENMGGRNWRSVEDTTFSPVIRSRGRGNSFGSRRRGSDYYTEMIFTWLEADGIIRRQTGGKKSIDDFAHLFYAGANNGPEIRPYARQEVIEALNTVCPYDWSGFIQTRVIDVRPHLNDGWLEKAGWMLAYDDNPRLGMGRQESRLELLGGIGLSIGNGEIEDVQEGSPADLAKLAVGMKIVSVNGRRFSSETMRKAIKDAETSTQPLRLSVDDYGAVRDVSVDYHGGLRYPHLKPIPGAPDLISPVAEAHAH